MFVSSREAATILGVTRDQARGVLAAGLAGPTLRLRSAVLHERAKVEALAARPESPVDRCVPDVMKHGVFIARVLNRGLDVRADQATQLATLREDWPVSPLARVELRLAIEAHGSLPLVATVCGFVAAGAEITAIHGSRQGHGRTGQGPTGTGTQGADLELRPPGAWFETFRETRLPTGPGAPWLHWKPLAEPSSRS